MPSTEVEVLSLAEISVIREFDTARDGNWDPPHCRASQSECDEHAQSLEDRGYLYSRTDKGWEGYVDATDKGRAQYEHWTGEPRERGFELHVKESCWTWAWWAQHYGLTIEEYAVSKEWRLAKTIALEHGVVLPELDEELLERIKAVGPYPEGWLPETRRKGMQ